MTSTASAPRRCGSQEKKTSKPRSTVSPIAARNMCRPLSLRTAVRVNARARLLVTQPDQAEAFQGQVWVDAVERARMGRDQVREAARGDGLRLDAELLPDAPDDAVHLAREAVDEARLETGDGGLPDDGSGRREVH